MKEDRVNKTYQPQRASAESCLCGSRDLLFEVHYTYILGQVCMFILANLRMEKSSTLQTKECPKIQYIIH